MLEFLLFAFSFFSFYSTGNYFINYFIAENHLYEEQVWYLYLIKSS